jgi:N utilization substance protein A
MTNTMAQNIFQSGFGSFQSLAQASVEEVISIPGYDDPDKAERLIKDAQLLEEKYAQNGAVIPSAPVVNKEVRVAGGDAKAQADARLREELAKMDAQNKADTGE